MQFSYAKFPYAYRILWRTAEAVLPLSNLYNKQVSHALYRFPYYTFSSVLTNMYYKKQSAFIAGYLHDLLVICSWLSTRFMGIYAGYLHVSLVNNFALHNVLSNVSSIKNFHLQTLAELLHIVTI